MIIKLLNRKLLLGLFFVLTFNSHLFSQTIFETIGSDFTIAVVDGYHLLSSPSKFSGTDWMITGGVVGSTAAVMPFDEDFRKIAGKNQNDFNDNLMSVGKAYGNLLSPVIIGGGIYSYGLLFKNENVRTTGRMIIESVAYAGAITTLLKSLSGRTRPYTENGSHFYKPLQTDDGYLSFPSGHSTVAFSISTVLANRIHNTYASIGLYTLAALTSVSRVYDDQHWASDVLLGSAIGYFVGSFISNNSGALYSDKKVSLNIQPTLNGLNCSLSF